MRKKKCKIISRFGSVLFLQKKNGYFDKCLIQGGKRVTSRLCEKNTLCVDVLESIKLTVNVIDMDGIGCYIVMGHHDDWDSHGNFAAQNRLSRMVRVKNFYHQ